MQLAELVGGRLRDGVDELPVYEGPIVGERVAMSLAETAVALRRLELELGDAGSTRRRIGILSNHQIETYLAVMASVIGDHTFVPLNPKFPRARLEAIVELGAIDVILHDSSTEALLADFYPSGVSIDVSAVVSTPASDDESREAGRWRSTVAERDVSATDTAYVMFTSGSTGTPKGVPISYRNLTKYVQGITETVKIERGLRFTQFFDLSFDLSIHDIFVSNICWGTLVAPSPIDLLMPSGYVSRERLESWFSVPILGAQLGRSAPKEGGHTLRHMLFCGEALPMETVVACRGWLTDGGDIWNLYGPTEATIAFTAARVTSSERTSGNASIGSPFGDNLVAIDVDGDVTELSPDTEGELLLGGPQVFTGYSTDAPSPFADSGGTRWYRSGDLVRADYEGIYYRGRLDSQVKYRGYRIELGEIEAAARQIFSLRTVAAVLDDRGNDTKIVLFYLRGESNTVLEPSAMRDALPSYMIPSSFVPLDAMPTNTNGKTDRKSLAHWEP